MDFELISRGHLSIRRVIDFRRQIWRTFCCWDHSVDVDMNGSEN